MHRTKIPAADPDRGDYDEQSSFLLSWPRACWRVASPVVMAAAATGQSDRGPGPVGRGAGCRPTTPGWSHFFHLRARGEPAQGTLDQLIENLAGSAPEARQQACADLVAIGTPALPRLRALVREGGRSAGPGPALRDGHRIRWRNLDQCGRSLACPPPYRRCGQRAPRLSAPCRK